MPAIQNANIDLVIDYLVTAQASNLGGRTVADIVAGTTLSKSTVHRAINKCPAICQNIVAGKATPTYYVDHGQLLNWKLSAKTGGSARRGLTFKTIDSAYAKKFLGQPPFEIINHLGSQIKDESLLESIRAVGEGYQRAYALQTEPNAEPFTDEDIIRIRAAISSLAQFGLQTLLYFNSLQSSRWFGNDSEFHRLWPLPKE